MLARVAAVAMNTFREAVRARVLYGLLGLAVATSAYSLVIASMSLKNELRIIADIGAASMSLYAVLVSIVLGATMLYRELELKTLYPILTRRLRRHEYLVGKFFGIVTTLATFLAVDAGVVFGLLAFEATEARKALGATVALALTALAAALYRARALRTFVVLPWSLAFAVAMGVLAAPAGAERQLVLASAVLALAEVSIVTALALLFSSFSSPFLSSLFTLGVFAVGRSADTLANLPERVFGSALRSVGIALSRVVPNLHAYVPARPLLLGQVPEVALLPYVVRAAANAALYAAVFLALASVVFRRRDLT